MENTMVAILVVDGWRFHSTYDSEKSAHRTSRNLASAIVKPFGVNISRINPVTMETIDWTKGEGWSVWTRSNP